MVKQIGEEYRPDPESLRRGHETTGINIRGVMWFVVIFVLTAAVTKPLSSQAHPVTDAPLGEVKVPVLLVHHKNDGCVVTPYAAMPELLAALKSAKKTELIGVEGGSRGSGTPCGGGHHQFLGIEAEVTKSIADWIRLNPPGK